MNNYKVKQAIPVTVTGSAVKVVVVKKETILYEKDNYCYGDITKDGNTKIYFSKPSLDGSPELFELMPDE